MNKTIRIQLALLSALCISLSLYGCGSGGGGGSSFPGAADLSLDVVPNSIDTGDRMQVQAQIGNVHPNGIALKFRMPTGLRYISGSAFLKVGSESIDVTPTFNVTESSVTPTAAATTASAMRASTTPAATATPDTSPKRYIVFFLSEALFIPTGEDQYNGEFATMTFQLEGSSEIESGKIEIDADVDDPTESNLTEFSITNPEFAAQDDFPIRVAG